MVSEAALLFPNGEAMRGYWNMSLEVWFCTRRLRIPHGESRTESPPPRPVVGPRLAALGDLRASTSPNSTRVVLCHYGGGGGGGGT